MSERMSLEEMVDLISGRKPLVYDHVFKSPCCGEPVGVYHGEIQNADGSPYTGGVDWQVTIVRKCSKCKAVVPPRGAAT